MSLWEKTLAKFHNLRMRNQIFLIEFFAFLISFILIASFYRIQQNVIIGIQENSSTIVLSRQDRIALNLFLPQLNYYMIAKQHQRIQLLSSLGTIYSNLNNYFVDENFENALPCQSKGQQDFLFQMPELCYTCFICQDETFIPEGNKFKLLLKFSRLLSEFVFLFDTMQNNRIFYISTGEPIFGCIYPQVIFEQGFNPQTKDWYSSHLKSYQVNSPQKYHFSQLYFSGTQFIYKLTISYSLQNQNDSSLDAIAGTDIDAEDENMKQVQANTYLLNQQGQIIYRNVNLEMNQKELNFIYQENKTGFNQTDWYEISNLAKGLDSTSNCLMEQTRILCRYNSIYKQPIKIVAKQIPGNFTLMMFTNSSFEQELKDSFKNIEQQTTNFQESGFYQQLGNSVILIGISMIIVILMFRPIIRVMKAAKTYIKSMGNNLDKEIFKLMNQNHKKKGLFGKLELQILNFGDVIEKSQQQKGLQCKVFESFQYSKQGNIGNKSSLLSEINKINLEKQIDYSQKQLMQMITKQLKLLNKNHHQIYLH